MSLILHLVNDSAYATFHGGDSAEADKLLSWWGFTRSDEWVRQGRCYLAHVRKLEVRDRLPATATMAQLLRDLIRDYDHAWPGEDSDTARHRERVLSNIRMIHDALQQEPAIVPRGTFHVGETPIDKEKAPEVPPAGEIGVPMFSPGCLVLFGSPPALNCVSKVVREADGYAYELEVNATGRHRLSEKNCLPQAPRCPICRERLLVDERKLGVSGLFYMHPGTDCWIPKAQSLPLSVWMNPDRLAPVCAACGTRTKAVVNFDPSRPVFEHSDTKCVASSTRASAQVWETLNRSVAKPATSLEYVFLKDGVRRTLHRVISRLPNGLYLDGVEGLVPPSDVEELPPPPVCPQCGAILHLLPGRSSYENLQYRHFPGPQYCSMNFVTGSPAEWRNFGLQGD